MKLSLSNKKGVILQVGLQLSVLSWCMVGSEVVVFIGQRKEESVREREFNGGKGNNAEMSFREPREKAALRK